MSKSGSLPIMAAMPDIQSVLKAEIARLARKEVRAELASLKKSSLQHRSQIAALKRQVEALQKSLQRLARAQLKAAPAAAEALEEGPARRFSAARLARTRQKLGLSAADFGALMGVTGQAVYKWESGEVRPRASQLEAIAQVRSLGKREATAKLEAVRTATGEGEKARPNAPASRKLAARPASQDARKRA